MASKNSLDEVTLIAALLHDVYTNRPVVVSERQLRLDAKNIKRRVLAEGVSFLTKTLPKLGKSLDKALACVQPLNCADLRLQSLEAGSQLPKLFGELFKKVLHSDGTVLPSPCVVCIRSLRDLCYLFYKYEIPYNEKEEKKVLDQFERTEQELLPINNYLRLLGQAVINCTSVRNEALSRSHHLRIVRRARSYLRRLLRHFLPTEIVPRHGPGVVATRQQLWTKYEWTNVSHRITQMWPFDAYFCASLNHVCDKYKSFTYTDEDLPARVILVPKDSRGPRLISCEPVDFQWIQQGLMRSLVTHVERHPLTRESVRFTNQQPNQFAALYGSTNGKYSTLDLKDASDRITTELVSLLFPSNIVEYLMAARSLSTELPDGRILPLNKFAPMGSAICFPVLALVIWSILMAYSPDRDTREGIYVYGDDVIVPTAFAADAMNVLESFGLKINHDKSCTKGFFRESCGVDAYKGENVTPVRIRTVWTSYPSPESYASWVAYANSFYDRKYFTCYDYIVKLLTSVYWPIADDSMPNASIRLREAPLQHKTVKCRVNKALQRLEYKTLEVKAVTVTKVIDGWSMLLRYFTNTPQLDQTSMTKQRDVLSSNTQNLNVSQYTKRKASILVERWR